MVQLLGRYIHTVESWLEPSKEYSDPTMLELSGVYLVTVEDAPHPLEIGKWTMDDHHAAVSALKTVTSQGMTYFNGDGFLESYCKALHFDVLGRPRKEKDHEREYYQDPVNLFSTYANTADIERDQVAIDSIARIKSLSMESGFSFTLPDTLLCCHSM